MSTGLYKYHRENGGDFIVHFQAFDSLEEMFAALDEARIAADGRVKPWQSEIKPGCFFVQLTDLGITIYGEILDPGDDEYYKTPDGKYYRFCKAYSVACIEGEMGDVHVSVISGIISKSLFEDIRMKGWNVVIPD
jgi:hypothetical protein